MAKGKLKYNWEEYIILCSFIKCFCSQLERVYISQVARWMVFTVCYMCTFCVRLLLLYVCNYCWVAILFLSFTFFYGKKKFFLLRRIRKCQLLFGNKIVFIDKMKKKKFPFDAESHIIRNNCSQVQQRSRRTAEG